MKYIRIYFVLLLLLPGKLVVSDSIYEEVVDWEEACVSTATHSPYVKIKGGSENTADGGTFTKHSSYSNFVEYQSGIQGNHTGFLLMNFNNSSNDPDGDGCPDAVEGSGNFTYADLDINDRLDFANLSPSGVGAKGVPNAASGGQSIGDSQDIGTLDPDGVYLLQTASQTIKLRKE